MRDTIQAAQSSPDSSPPQSPFVSVTAQQNKDALRSLFLWRALCAMCIFIVLCVLVFFNATHGVDQWLFALANTVVSEPLDLAASVITLAGNAELTGTLALACALLGWKRQGVRGLAPMLLFLGVAIEIILKFSLPHPHLPEGSGRNIEFLPPLRFPTPYSFPSGHMLRATFLVIYLTPEGGVGRVVGWMFVLAMALTRLYLNEHWTSDIIGGAFLGFALAAVARATDGRNISP